MTAYRTHYHGFIKADYFFSHAITPIRSSIMYPKVLHRPLQYILTFKQRLHYVESHRSFRRSLRQSVQRICQTTDTVDISSFTHRSEVQPGIRKSCMSMREVTARLQGFGLRIQTSIERISPLPIAWWPILSPIERERTHRYLVSVQSRSLHNPLASIQQI